MKGLKECPQCGSIGWKETNSKFFRCTKGHRFGNKFGALRVVAPTSPLGEESEFQKRFGHCDSKLEADYYKEHLAWLEKAGEITQVRHHTIIALLPNFTYETDWDYMTKEGLYRIVDTKGVEDARFKCILALWPIFGHAPLDVVKRGGRGFITRTVMAGKWDAKQTAKGWQFKKVA